MQNRNERGRGNEEWVGGVGVEQRRERFRDTRQAGSFGKVHPCTPAKDLGIFEILVEFHTSGKQVKSVGKERRRYYATGYRYRDCCK